MRRLPDIQCQYCNITFHPIKRTSKYCSVDCADKAKCLTTEAKPCQECGEMFNRLDGELIGNFKHRKFCSSECRRVYRSKRMSNPTFTRECKHCGKELTVRAGTYTKVFCDTACYVAFKQAKMKTYLCHHCGKSYYRIPARPGLYCSKECSIAGQYGTDPKEISKSCLQCGSDFTRPLKYERHKPNIFCSRKCYWKYIVGPNAPLWQGGISFEPYPASFNNDLRRAIRERDGHQCKVCGKTEKDNGRALSVHHIDYDKANVRPDNLISLCTPCHTYTNHNRTEWTVRLQAIIASHVSQAPHSGP